MAQSYRSLVSLRHRIREHSKLYRYVKNNNVYNRCILSIIFPKRLTMVQIIRHIL